ncbi:SET domain-containing protein [Xylariomycetidae sp. FL2044]|nr:SET domain-containing protein [Xylariomycetidae sp. FL2044]
MAHSKILSPWRSTGLIYGLVLALQFSKSFQSANIPSMTCSTNPVFSAHNRTCPTPIDDDSTIDTGNWEPWTYRPYCLEPSDGDRTGPEFCLYTSSTFRNNQGLSVISSPELAASIADMLDDSIVPLRLRVYGSREGGVEPPYEITKVPGKGLGLVATRNIPPFEVVMVDYPSMVARLDTVTTLDPDGRLHILEKAVRQLPEHQQEMIYSLARTGEEDEEEIIENILRTNIFGLELGDLVHMGLYPRASRINHDCKPNVYWKYIPATLTVEIVAIQPIAKGQEIVQSYVPLGLPYEQRQQDLAKWNFECTCSLCAASQERRAVSDQRRARLREIYRLLTEDASLSPKQVDRHAREAEALARKEELVPQLLVYFELAARAFLYANDMAGARKYARRCEDLWVRYGGDDHDNVEGMKRLWKDLE